MQIGYSERTLWNAIDKQWQAIEDELAWMNHYIAIGEVFDVEDCVKNIQISLDAIKENVNYLKGEFL